MPFVARRPDGSIYGLWTVQQFVGQLELPDSDPEVLAFRTPPPPRDFSDVDNLDKTVKTLALCIAQVGSLTVAQMKALFKQKWDSLP
jgi:hypothetical protein